MDGEALLMRFGLTYQEARLYACLHRTGDSTGYELAKATGISRSNAYAGLSSLVEKGGAWLIDGKPACYRAVPVREFCRGVLRNLDAARMELEQCLPRTTEQEEAYITVKGEKNIHNKIEAMILDTKTHIYLSMPSPVLDRFLDLLMQRAEAGCKVVALTDNPPTVEGITVYRNREQPDAIRVISDTAAALTGSLDNTVDCSCLYSGKKNLVSLLRDSMSNEIKLIKITGGDKT